MTLPMDIRLAADNAKFGFVFARRGIVPEACSSYFLPRVAGISRALEWCYSGRVFPAQEALEGGLVRALYPKDDLLSQARAIAEDIRDNTAPVSVALVRHMMWRMLNADHPMEAHKIDSRGIYHRVAAQRTPKKGVESFLEKRPGRVCKGKVSGRYARVLPLVGATQVFLLSYRGWVNRCEPITATVSRSAPEGIPTVQVLVRAPESVERVHLPKQ